MLLDAGAEVDRPDTWNETALDFAHTSLARHSWWSGLASVEAGRAREIVDMLGGNGDFGVEQVIRREAKFQRLKEREEAKQISKLERRAAVLEERRRTNPLHFEYMPVD